MDEYRRLVAQVPRYRDLDGDGATVKHYCGVSHLTFSSDGQLMASCGEDARYNQVASMRITSINF